MARTYTTQQRQHSSRAATRRWQQIRAAAQRLELGPMTVNQLQSDPLLKAHWKLLVDGPGNAYSKKVVQLVQTLCRHALERRSHCPSHFGTVNTRKADPYIEWVEDAPGKPATGRTRRATETAPVSGQTLVRVSTPEPAPQPSEQPSALEKAANDVRIAIWYIKQVGDVQRARKLLDLAADTMEAALVPNGG